MKHHDTAISHNQGNIQKSYMKHRSFLMREVSTLKRFTSYTIGLKIFAQVVWFWIHKPIPESIDEIEHSQSSRFYVVMEVVKLHKEYQGTRSNSRRLSPDRACSLGGYHGRCVVKTVKDELWRCTTLGVGLRSCRNIPRELELSAYPSLQRSTSKEPCMAWKEHIAHQACMVHDVPLYS